MKALTAAGQVALATILLHHNFTAGSGGAELRWYLVPFGATLAISLSWTELACFLSADSFWVRHCCSCFPPCSASIAVALSTTRRAAAKLSTELNGSGMPEKRCSRNAHVSPDYSLFSCPSSADLLLLLSTLVLSTLIGHTGPNKKVRSKFFKWPERTTGGEDTLL